MPDSDSAEISRGKRIRFELVETKGFETRDWKMLRQEIEVLWLPEHPPYSYTLVKVDER